MVSKSDIEAFTYLIDHPEEFPFIAYSHGPDGNAVSIEDWQREALRALRKNARLAIRSGHGVGKTTFLSFVIHWFLLTHYPCKIPTTANSQSQLFDVLWSELGIWHRCMKPEFKQLITMKADRIELAADPANAFGVARTARREQPEALQGFHSENVLFVIDEGSGIDEKIFEVARGAMSTEGSITVITGNPTRTSGFFHNAFHKMKARWWTKTVSCFDSTRVDSEYPKEIADDYGIDSNVYRVRVLGLPPKEDEDAVISRYLAEMSQGREVQQTGPEVWGVDVSRFGNDRSALCKRRGNVVTEPVKWWRQKDNVQLAALINEEYEAAPVKPAEICVDVIGVGSGVYDILATTHRLPVKAVNVGERPAIHDDKYERLRDELWFKMKEWFASYKVAIPKSSDAEIQRELDDFLDELTGVKYKFNASGKIKVESKAEMKSRGMKSPDLAEAFLMTFASQAAHNRAGDGWYSDEPVEVDYIGVV